MKKIKKVIIFKVAVIFLITSLAHGLEIPLKSNVRPVLLFSKQDTPASNREMSRRTLLIKLGVAGLFAAVRNAMAQQEIIVAPPGANLQETIDKALPGTTIRLLAGDYYSPAFTSLKLRRGIRLIGAGPLVTHYHYTAPFFDSRAPSVVLGADDAVLEGLSLEAIPKFCIQLSDVSGMTIRNCIVWDVLSTNNTAILLVNSHGNLIEGNTLGGGDNSTTAASLYLFDATDNLITRNRFLGQVRLERSLGNVFERDMFFIHDRANTANTALSIRQESKNNRLDFCTIYDQRNPLYGRSGPLIIVAEKSTGNVISNSIVASGEREDMRLSVEPGSVLTIHHSLFDRFPAFNSTTMPREGVLVGPPGFVGPEGDLNLPHFLQRRGDPGILDMVFSLRQDSLAKGAADPAGVRKPDGSRADLGALPFDFKSDVAISPPQPQQLSEVSVRLSGFESGTELQNLLAGTGIEPGQLGFLRAGPQEGFTAGAGGTFFRGYGHTGQPAYFKARSGEQIAIAQSGELYTFLISVVAVNPYTRIVYWPQAGKPPFILEEYDQLLRMGFTDAGDLALHFGTKTILVNRDSIVIAMANTVRYTDKPEIAVTPTTAILNPPDVVNAVIADFATFERDTDLGRLLAGTGIDPNTLGFPHPGVQAGYEGTNGQSEFRGDATGYLPVFFFLARAKGQMVLAVRGVMFTGMGGYTLVIRPYSRIVYLRGNNLAPIALEVEQFEPYQKRAPVVFPLGFQSIVLHQNDWLENVSFNLAGQPVVHFRRGGAYVIDAYGSIQAIAHQVNYRVPESSSLLGVEADRSSMKTDTNLDRLLANAGIQPETIRSFSGFEPGRRITPEKYFLATLYDSYPFEVTSNLVQSGKLVAPTAVAVTGMRRIPRSETPDEADSQPYTNFIYWPDPEKSPIIGDVPGRLVRMCFTNIGQSTLVSGNLLVLETEEGQVYLVNADGTVGFAGNVSYSYRPVRIYPEIEADMKLLKRSADLNGLLSGTTIDPVVLEEEYGMPKSGSLLLEEWRFIPRNYLFMQWNASGQKEWIVAVEGDYVPVGNVGKIFPYSFTLFQPGGNRKPYVFHGFFRLLDIGLSDTLNPILRTYDFGCILNRDGSFAFVDRIRARNVHSFNVSPATSLVADPEYHPSAEEIMNKPCGLLFSNFTGKGLSGVGVVAYDKADIDRFRTLVVRLRAVPGFGNLRYGL